MTDTPTVTATAKRKPRQAYLRLPRPAVARLRDTVARAYLNGATIRELAAAHGYSYATMHRIVTDSGVRLRRRGGPYSNLTSARLPSVRTGQEPQR